VRNNHFSNMSAPVCVPEGVCRVVALEHGFLLDALSSIGAEVIYIEAGRLRQVSQVAGRGLADCDRGKETEISSYPKLANQRPFVWLAGGAPGWHPCRLFPTRIAG